MQILKYEPHRNRFLLIAVILFICIGNALAQGSPTKSPALPPGESEKIDTYLRTYHSGVIVTNTATDRSGQTISCVDIQHQPALNNPALKGHKIQMEPSDALVAILKAPVKKEVPSEPSTGFMAMLRVPVKNDGTLICPTGSVAMRLPTHEQIARAGSLGKFLSKYPDGSPGRVGIERNVLAPALSGHEYAVAYQWVGSIAAQSTLNVWDAYIGTVGDMTLSQLWMVGGTGTGTQTVEVGSNVYPALYGDNYPHIFIYYTADNYHNTGCYNYSCNAFVQTSSTLWIGGALISSSVSGGTQLEGTLAFYRDPATGNWWLYYFDGTTYYQIGYYPGALYGSGQLSQYAQLIEYGGEMYSGQTSPHSATDMGSGQFPNAGYGYAAYQRNLKYLDTNFALHDFFGSTITTNPNCYDIAWGTNPAWGTSIYFGGPGYSSICP